MKKISILFSILFLLNIFSCSKDNASSSTSTITTTPTTCKFENSTFVGKWKLTKVEVNGKDSSTSFFTQEPCYKTFILEFKSSGIVSESNITGCSVSPDRNWKIFSNSNKNYLVGYDSNDQDTLEILSFSCTSFSTNHNYDEKFTYTKQ